MEPSFDRGKQNETEKLSLPEWLLIVAAVAIMLVNAVLQIEALRYLTWGLVVVVVILNMMFETCPDCGKRVRNHVLVWPRCGKQLIEVEDFEDEENDENEF